MVLVSSAKGWYTSIKKTPNCWGKERANFAGLLGLWMTISLLLFLEIGLSAVSGFHSSF
jgi:hypothetical protein